MTAAQARAYNEGVRAVLAIAEKSAATLNRDPRHIPVSFAQAALAGLAEAGRMLIVDEHGPEPDLQIQAPR